VQDAFFVIRHCAPAVPIHGIKECKACAVQSRIRIGRGPNEWDDLNTQCRTGGRVEILEGDVGDCGVVVRQGGIVGEDRCQN
jgi:hypothetical protein